MGAVVTYVIFFCKVFEEICSHGTSWSLVWSWALSSINAHCSESRSLWREPAGVKCFLLSWVRDDTERPGRLEASSISRAFFVLIFSSSSRVSRATSKILKSFHTADHLKPACLLYSVITWWYHSACALRAWADTDFSLLNKRPHPTYGPTMGVAAVKGGLLCRCRVATPRAFKSGNRSFTLGATPGSGGWLWASVSHTLHGLKSGGVANLQSCQHHRVMWKNTNGNEHYDV